MNVLRKNRGFTSVEILVAVVSAAILATMAGTMLAYGYKSWRQNSIAVELQRDATAAMEMLSWKVRATSSSRVTVTTNEVVIQPVDVLVDPTISFTMDGSDFVFDPDTVTDDDELIIINDRVQNLIFSNMNFGIAVHLVLESQNEATEVNSILSYRN